MVLQKQMVLPYKSLNPYKINCLRKCTAEVSSPEQGSVGTELYE